MEKQTQGFDHHHPRPTDARRGRLWAVQRPHRYRAPAGLSIPVVTILDRAGHVLVEEQRAVVRYAAQEGAGADIIFAVGTTGEWDKLANSQRQLAARIAVEECSRCRRRDGGRVEAWVGITAHTRAEALENLAHALEIGADAAVVAPLSIADVEDPVDFITRDLSRVFERSGRTLPVFLYDNADIAAPGRAPHLHTRDVKTMSRLPYVSGVKVTAGAAVLGNYTRAASHFRRREFAIYPGNAYLIFDLFMPSSGFVGLMHGYWNRFLTRSAMPYGVVAGAANVMPREWQRAWQVCRMGDAALIARYGQMMEEYRTACDFERAGHAVRPTIACHKAALRDLGVCTIDAVAPGTPALDEAERRQFIRRFRDLRRRTAATLESEWLSEWAPAQPPLRRRAYQDA